MISCCDHWHYHLFRACACAHQQHQHGIGAVFTSDGLKVDICCTVTSLLRESIIAVVIDRYTRSDMLGLER